MYQKNLKKNTDTKQISEKVVNQGLCMKSNFLYYSLQQLFFFQINSVYNQISWEFIKRSIMSDNIFKIRLLELHNFIYFFSAREKNSYNFIALKLINIEMILMGFIILDLICKEQSSTSFLFDFIEYILVLLFNYLLW